MDRASKILIGGILAGTLLYGLGEMQMRRLERRVQELEKACVAEKGTEGKAQGALSALTSLFTSKSTCDPVDLARSSGYSGIQGQLGAAQRDAMRWDNWHLIGGIALSVLCSFPWLWYFLLRRIRELREAILGR
jgi:hypothetical protein